MSTPTIVAIEWLDKDAEEAVLTISDGTHSLRCFAHPFRGVRGAPVASPLATLDAENVVRAPAQSVDVRPVGSGFKHEVIGVVSKTLPPTVRVGDLLLELDVSLPGDVSVGELVEFVTDRIDYEG